MTDFQRVNKGTFGRPLTQLWLRSKLNKVLYDKVSTLVVNKKFQRVDFVNLRNTKKNRDFEEAQKWLLCIVLLGLIHGRLENGSGSDICC